jgi:hypothetical protein
MTRYNAETVSELRLTSLTIRISVQAYEKNALRSRVYLHTAPGIVNWREKAPGIVDWREKWREPC